MGVTDLALLRLRLFSAVCLVIRYGCLPQCERKKGLGAPFLAVAKLI